VTTGQNVVNPNGPGLEQRHHGDYRRRHNCYVLRELLMLRCLPLIVTGLLGATPSAVAATKKLPITVTPANQTTPSVTVNNLTPKAGDTITITFNPGSSVTSASDFVQLNYVKPQQSCNIPPGSDGSELSPLQVATPSVTPGPHTARIRIPMVPSDVNQYYQVEYWQNAPAGTNPCQGGSPAYIAATSPKITVAPTLPTPVYPPAPSMTYPPPGWPAKPNETITVCKSGCQFNNLDDVSWYINWQDTNRDWIKVDVQSGTYFSYGRYGAFGQYGNCGGMPGRVCAKHVWFYGHGVSRPVITCSPTNPLVCAGVLGPSGIHTVIDNIEVENTIKAGANSPAVGGIACESTNANDRDSLLLRNAYIHDGGQGMLGGGSCAYDVTFQNSHVARFGGPVGPAHDVYYNDFSPGHWGPNPTIPALLADGHVVVDHSVLELVDTGHSLKTHSNRTDISCSQITTGTAEVYSGSQALDLDGGGGQVTVTNSLIVGGPYYYNPQANSSWFMEFGGDKSNWDGDQPSQFLVITNSYIINDRGQFMLGLNAPMQPSQPYTWSNNVFIGPWDDGYTAAACGGSVPCKTPASVLPTSPIVGRLTDINFGCAGGDCTPLRDTGIASSMGNLFFSSRAQARAHNWPSSTLPIQDLSTRTDQGGMLYTAWPYDPRLYPMPAGCTAPVGNVQWPQ
jgi:hypothetical protein